RKIDRLERLRGSTTERIERQRWRGLGGALRGRLRRSRDRLLRARGTTCELLLEALDRRIERRCVGIAERPSERGLDAREVAFESRAFGGRKSTCAGARAHALGRLEGEGSDVAHGFRPTGRPCRAARWWCEGSEPSVSTRSRRPLPPGDRAS